MPVRKFSTIGGIKIEHLEAAVMALKEVAHIDAAHSQGLARFDAEDTYQWRAATAIQVQIDRKKVEKKAEIAAVRRLREYRKARLAKPSTP
jgi:hypothetical protein